MSALQFETFTKRYATGQGVFDIDLEVKAGAFFGFIGENGAGKSTAIRSALGLLRPTSGRVSLLGTDVTGGGAAAAAVRADVGYVPSEPGLWDGRSVSDTLAYLGGFVAHDTTARRRVLCDTLELDVSRAASDLSLGNKKKVALVAALQHRPRLVILDEPTAGLDPLIQQRLFQVLAEEQAHGATVFFSSHVLAEVERVCSDVAIIKAGRLVRTASVAELKRDSVRRVSVTAKAGVDLKAARCLTVGGVVDVAFETPNDASEAAHARVTFSFTGALPELLRALADDAPHDVTITTPTLEEIVLSHYGRSAASPAGAP